jgi:hypothetical protein
MRAAEGIVACVLVQRTRQQPRRKIRIVRLVQKAAPRIRPEAVHAFAQRRMRVHALRRQRSQSQEDKRRVVQRLVVRHREVVPPTRRRRLGAPRDGTEVRHQPKDAFRLNAFQRDRVAIGVHWHAHGSLRLLRRLAGRRARCLRSERGTLAPAVRNQHLSGRCRRIWKLQRKLLGHEKRRGKQQCKR